MAPAAAAEFFEVRCAGCGETLEVEPALTEFACPDCAPASLPCAACAALLSVPAGLARFACPLCGRRAHCRRRASPSIPRLPAPRHSHRPGAAPGRHYFEFEANPTAASRGVEKVRQEPPIHASSASRSRAQVCSSNYPVRAQGQRPVEDVTSHGQQINEHRAVPSTIQHKTIEAPNQANCVEQGQGDYHSEATVWNLKRKRSGKSAIVQKGKRKGLTSYPNGGVHLRRSARLSKQPENPINDEPVQQPAALNQCDSDPLNIDKIISNLCSSPFPQHQMPQASSSQSGQVDAATGPPQSNHDASQDGQFPLCYSQLYPPEVPGEHLLDRIGDEQPHSPEDQFHITHVQQEDAQRGHSLLGSVVKSSGKRRGRGHQPTRLIQPRREVDRPVLTPNIIDKWDVNPPCPNVASTITILLKQNYPGSTYLPAGQRREVPPNGEVVLHWQQYPRETRDAILNEFLQRYKWAPGREAECLKLFERRAARQFAGILSEEKRKVRVKFAAVDKSNEASGAHRSTRHAESEDEDQEEEPEDQQALGRSDKDDPLLWKRFPPAWMYPSWWERLCEHWAKEEVLQMSSQNRKNRYTGGRAHHTSGSRSIAMHRQIMVIENGGVPVSELEVFNKTHRRNGGTGEFVSERAKRTVEGFKKRMDEAGDKIHPHLAWVQEVGGRNRGRYYGLTGIIDKGKVDELAKSMPNCSGIKGHRQKFTQEQVQQMINQALQGLNETWEKKFKSLEQSLHGVPPLGIDPEHAPGSSAAREGGQEDQSRHHQNASDAQTGESHEEDDEEMVSTSV
ncbi:hypothetical protein C2845_PM15G21560 [Panicum miliaceum]|uniref:FORGETTER1 first zinc ribbon domain-containing protein n=1 Tax=Panicum miliaceum TaxID=4540 RepID=A0A3L6QAE9_PANMI|nr:hypothetical protein C2845_PM15G21560 [Panicum miliaceum]